MLIKSNRIILRNLLTNIRQYKTYAWNDVSKTRNVGIIAHIDGGKTTLTESILHQSGILKNRGNVDEGTTITDYLPAERERGITIQSASVPLEWKDHRINLIDTPGHADFAIEVERSVRVLDGGVVILDGVEGVEAQTEGVWKQAKRYNLNSMILFVNKMDRIGANFSNSIRSILNKKIHFRPLVLQLPVYKSSGDGLESVVDILNPDIEQINNVNQKNILNEVNRARECAIETLSEVDEELMNKFLECEDYNKINNDDIKLAIKRQTHNGNVLPILCGSALKNINVDSVLNSMVDYLPSPNDVPSTQTLCGKEVSIGDPTISCIALAFKVVWDSRKGWLTWVRVYSGTLNRSKTLWNSTNNSKERINKLMLMSADDNVEIDNLYAGQIGVIIGCKNTKTGDTLVDNRDVNHRNVQLKNITIPPPVFSVSIEPESLSEEKPVHEALRSLIRSDPSLVLSESNETQNLGGDGQTLLSGLGELHLEISYRRLIEEFGVRAKMGPMRVGYQESLKPDQFIERREDYSREINKKLMKASVTVEITNKEVKENGDSNNEIEIDVGQYGVEYKDAVKAGIEAGTSRGPVQGHAVRNLRIKVKDVELVDKELSPPSALTAAVSLGLVKAIKGSEVVVIEPLMDVNVQVYDNDVGKVISDLTSVRNGVMFSLDEDVSVINEDENISQSLYLPPKVEVSTKSIESDDKGSRMKIHAQVPLSGMVAYSTQLNALSGGSGNFNMKICGWKESEGEQTTVL